MVTNLLKLWNITRLTWLGKITVIKSIIISKINYAISSLEVPGWFSEEIRNLLNNLLWEGKPPRIKNIVIQQNRIQDWGMSMINFDYYVMAQKVNWVKRLLENQTTIPFLYLKKYLPRITLQDVFNVPLTCMKCMV